MERSLLFTARMQSGGASTATTLACLLTVASGCYSTQTAALGGLVALPRGDSGREIVVRQGVPGVHMGPRSWVRFRRDDGTRTRWVQAGTLFVSEQAIVVPGRPVLTGALPEPTERLNWRAIQSIEVNDVDLARSAGGLVGGTGLVVLAITADAVLMLAVASVTGHGGGEGPFTRGVTELVSDQVLKRPENDPPVNPWRAPPSPRLAPVEPLVSRPLFAPSAWRRDLFLFTVGSEVGLASGTSSGAVGAIAVGVRFVHVVEVAAGVRGLPQPTFGRQRFSSVASEPFVRAGLHLDLDAARRCALVVGGEAGYLDRAAQLRLVYGFRLRPTDSLQVGFYPWNPVKAVGPAASSQPPVAAHVSLMEVSWLF
ncbi:MAG TPA: hypothetical protein VNO55_25205 [Polyangia bacterium]|nr:hypothetical protein [Polyangia bacterium]